jgi:hypothetical protein
MAQSRGAAHVHLHRQGRPFASPLSTHWPSTPPTRSRAAPARSWRRGRAQRCALLPARLPARPPWSAPPPPLSHWPAPNERTTSGATAALGPLLAEARSADPTCVCSAEGVTTQRRGARVTLTLPRHLVLRTALSRRPRLAPTATRPARQKQRQARARRRHSSTRWTGDGGEGLRCVQLDTSLVLVPTPLPPSRTKTSTTVRLFSRVQAHFLDIPSLKFVAGKHQPLGHVVFSVLQRKAYSYLERRWKGGRGRETGMALLAPTFTPSAEAMMRRVRAKKAMCERDSAPRPALVPVSPPAHTCCRGAYLSAGPAEAVPA